MARGRMLSKTLGTSRKFAQCGEFPQLLFTLLVSHADDFGRQSGDTFTVKNRVFPTSPRSEAEFDAALQALEAVDLIVRYDAGGHQALAIVQFELHQQGLHKRTKSQFPEPPGTSGKFPLNRTEFNPPAHPNLPGSSGKFPGRSSLSEAKRESLERQQLAINEQMAAAKG